MRLILHHPHVPDNFSKGRHLLPSAPAAAGSANASLVDQGTPVIPPASHQVYAGHQVAQHTAGTILCVCKA
jgi:hypothetical protein